MWVWLGRVERVVLVMREESVDEGASDSFLMLVDGLRRGMSAISSNIA